MKLDTIPKKKKKKKKKKEEEEEENVPLLLFPRSSDYGLATADCVPILSSWSVTNAVDCPYSGTGPQSPENVQQSCPLYKAARIQHWPLYNEAQTLHCPVYKEAQTLHCPVYKEAQT